jgi:uncharacterized protein
MSPHTHDLDANKHLIQRFFDTFSAGDVDGVLDYLDEDCLWWVSGSVPGISGRYTRQQMRELLTGIVDVYEAGALPISIRAMTAEGPRVAVEASSCAKLKNGRLFQNTYHFLFELADKRIVNIREYSDTLHMYETFVAP